MVGRKKGTTKTGGRVKGTKNKITATQKQWIEDFLTRKQPEMEKEWDKLEPKDKWQMFEKLTGYIVPKMTSAQIDPSQLTDEQLYELINRIIKDMK